VPFVVVGHALRVVWSPYVPGFAASWLGIAVALAWKHLGLAALLMLGAFRGVDESYLEAARQLGSGTGRVTRDILVPMAAPALAVVVWSLAERWTYPAAWPQRLGFRYWSRMLTADFLDPLKTGLGIAAVVTVAALLCAVPLGYALARLRFPGRTLVLLAFLLPQAFPQLPVFAAATREFYRWGLAGTITGVVLVHLVGGLVFAVWTMAAVFRAMDPALEE